MSDNVSILSLIAIVFYAGVALSSMAACGTAAKTGQPTWNRNVWLALSALFVVLIVLRGFGIEEWARDAMRDMLRSEGNYEERRSIQGIVASVVIVAVALSGLVWLYRATRKLRGRRNIVTMAALVSGAGMVFLVLLRMISLHMIDRALYGPFKLNWIADLGTSLIVLGGSLYYMKLVRARP